MLVQGRRQPVDAGGQRGVDAVDAVDDDDVLAAAQLVELRPQVGQRRLVAGQALLQRVQLVGQLLLLLLLRRRRRRRRRLDALGHRLETGLQRRQPLAHLIGGRPRCGDC